MSISANLWLEAEPLILGSGSAARREMLTAAGLPVEVVKPEIDERAVEQPLIEQGVPADQIAAALACAKALAVSRERPGRLVLAADQTLTCEGVAFHKPADAAAATLRDDPPAGSDDPGMWVVRQDAVAFSTRMGSQGHSEFALMIDDRDEAVSTDDFVDAWRLWLHLSNIIGWRDDLAGVEILALSQVGGVAPVADIGVVDMPVSPIAVEWQALSEAATSAERRVIARLATVPDMPVPTMGVELGDGIPFSFVWERLRVAATTGPKWLRRTSMIGTRGGASSSIAAAKAAVSVSLSRTHRPRPTSSALARKGMRQPQSRN